MPGRSWRIGRIAGIPIGISPWWLLVVALFTWTLGGYYFPAEVQGISAGVAYALGFASVLLLFASILLHELGHAVVARRCGIAVAEIDLWLLGGVSRMESEARSPDDELRYAIAGPGVTAVVLVVVGALDVLLPASSPRTVRALVDYQVYVNALLLGFNLVPAFPLDGGRIARALMWRRSGDLWRATERAAQLGRLFGYALIALGLFGLLDGAIGALWLALIGWFIVAAAGAQAQVAEIEAVFSGTTAAEVMSAPPVTIPADTSIRDAVVDYLAPYGFAAFPVIDADGRPVGLLTVARAQSVPLAGRDIPVSDIAERDPALQVTAQADVAELLTRPAFVRIGRAAVLDGDGRVAGIISITDVQRAMRSARLAVPPGRERVAG